MTEKQQDDTIKGPEVSSLATSVLPSAQSIAR